MRTIYDVLDLQALNPFELHILETFGEVDAQKAWEGLSQIAKHGCFGGVGGLIYHSEIKEFHNQWEFDIWNLIEELALDEGRDPIDFLDTVARNTNGFGRFGITDLSDLRQWATWVAVEWTAFKLAESLEEKLDPAYAA